MSLELSAVLIAGYAPAKIAANMRGKGDVIDPLGYVAGKKRHFLADTQGS
jgi:hypothetical protein